MPRPGRWRAVLTLILVLPLVGCSSLIAAAPPALPTPEPPTAVPSPVTALHVAVTERDGGNLPVWLAYAAGIFRKHGLEVALTQEPDRAALDALLTGERDVVVGNSAPALVAAARGADPRVIAGLLNTFPYRLMVAPSIETPADLRGARLGVGRPGSASDVATRLALRELDLEPGKDVALLQVAAAQERQAALENGAIQGAMVVPPETVFLERLEFHGLLDLAATHVDGPNRQVIVAARLPRERPQLAQRFVNALVEATALAKRDRALAQRVLGEYLNLNDEAALNATYDLFVRQLAPRVPYPTVAGVSRLLPVVRELEPRASALDPASLLDRRFVQQAVDSGLVDRVDRGG